MRVGDRVRVHLPASAMHGATGQVIREYPSMDQCLVALDGRRGIIGLSVEALEAV